MTGSERLEVAEIGRRMDRLERNLFGEDGTGGALGALRDDIKPALVFYQRVTGIVALLTVIGVVVGILAAVVTIAKGLGVLA